MVALLVGRGLDGWMAALLVGRVLDVWMNGFTAGGMREGKLDGGALLV